MLIIYRFKSIVFLLIILFVGCHHPEEDCHCDDENATLYSDSTNVEENKTTQQVPEKVDEPCDWSAKLRNSGLVNIQKEIPTIRVELKYSTLDNFMHADVYGCLDSCYVQPDVVAKLSIAQNSLRKQFPNYTLLIYDGVRPRSVQQIMWDTLKMPVIEKVKFVSNPKNGSLHNYGAAVDVTIFDNASNQPLDMGAPYDFIGKLAWPTQEKRLLAEGKLTSKNIENRKLLRQVMHEAGFFNIQTEWWHFNSCRREVAEKKYAIIE